MSSPQLSINSYFDLIFPRSYLQIVCRSLNWALSATLTHICPPSLAERALCPELSNNSDIDFIFTHSRPQAVRRLLTPTPIATLISLPPILLHSMCHLPNKVRRSTFRPFSPTDCVPSSQLPTHKAIDPL